MPDESIVLAVPGTAELHLTTISGRVTVQAEERSDVLIESGAPPSHKIDVDPTGRIALTSARAGSAHLKVRCPVGTDVVIGTVSGAVELRGTLGEVRVTTVSSSVFVERAESVDIRSVSGSIEVEHASGRCRLKTKSGKVVCGSAGPASLSTISGRIRVGGATSSVAAQSASGSIELALEGKGDVAVQTISGSVRVEVPPDVRPSPRLRSLSGRPRFECEEGTDCKIAVRSLSGTIEVVPGRGGWQTDA